MKIGIVPTISGSSGGTYQYSLTMLEALQSKGVPEVAEDDFVLFVLDDDGPATHAARSAGWRVETLHAGVRSHVRRRLRRSVRSLLTRLPMGGLPRRAWVYWRERRNPGRSRVRARSADRMARLGMDLMVYPTPTPLSFEAGIPYVMSIHDLQHRLQPEFPEVSAAGAAREREYVFRNAAKHAAVILAESDVGKEDILNCYGGDGVEEEAIHVVPYLPPTYLSCDVAPADLARTRSRYQLPNEFLFYPAQFWPHKNHARIIQALAILRSRGERPPPLVLCGSHSGTLREKTFGEAMATAERLGVDASIHYIGYVPDEDMAALYAQAIGLVMPTFFGPTNIPFLEAWTLSCPLLTSDIRGIREQVGDAGVLVDPRSAEAIADGIDKICSSESFRDALTRAGHERLAAYTPYEYRERLGRALNEAKARASVKPRAGSQDDE